MATKPTIADARWAETAGGTPSAGISAPSSSKRDTGWAVEKPTYQNVNYLLRQFYLWAKYISEGRSFRLPAAAGGGVNPATAYVYADSADPGGYWTTSSTIGQYFVDFPLTPNLAVGDILRTLTVNVNESAAGGEVINARLYRLSATGARTQLSTTKTSGTGGGDVTLSWTSADTDLTNGYTAVAGESLICAVEMPSTASASAARCYGVTVN